MNHFLCIKVVIIINFLRNEGDLSKLMVGWWQEFFKLFRKSIKKWNSSHQICPSLRIIGTRGPLNMSLDLEQSALGALQKEYSCTILCTSARRLALLTLHCQCFKSLGVDYKDVHEILEI